MRIVLTLIVLAVIGVAMVRLMQSQLPNLSVTGAPAAAGGASQPAGAQVGRAVSAILEAGAQRASEAIK